jgi:hypothetical protein
MLSSLTWTTELIGGAATDFDVFRDAGVPGYTFAYLRGSSIYHTERDTVSSLNIDGLGHQASLALGLARDPEPLDLGSDAGEAVFFTLPGRAVVRYGSGVAVGGALLAALVAGWVLRVRFRRSSSLARLGAGAGFVVGGVVASALILTVVWIGAAALRPNMGVVESYAWLLALAACVAGSWYLVWRLSQHYRADTTGSVLVLWGLLALVTGIWAQPVSYLFVWPALTAGSVIAAARFTTGTVGRLVAAGVACLPTAVVLTPVVDTFLQMATPRPGNPDSELPATIAVVLLLVFLAVALIHTVIESQTDTAQK